MPKRRRSAPPAPALGGGVAGEASRGGGGRGNAKGGGRAGASTHGPPTRTSSGALSAGASDDWETLPSAWSAVAPHLAAYRARRVWMPFYYNGRCAEHLRALGFEDVVHERGVDFFERVKDKRFMRSVDLILDNPPYTSPQTKEAVLRTLAATGKPWCMLLPISALHVGFVREAVDVDRLQTLVPRRVMVKKANSRTPVPFKYLCWLAWGCGLERDLILMDDAPEAELAAERAAAAAGRSAPAAPRGRRMREASEGSGSDEDSVDDGSGEDVD
eukprot:PRCOL_00007060-RA